MKTRIRSVLAHKGHQVHSVPVGVPVREAARLMADLHIGSVLVQAGSHTVGILTERDLARRVCQGHGDVLSRPVEELMTSPLAYITPGDTVVEAMKVMSETHCRHLPVLDGGTVVGVISLGDLVRWLTVDLEEKVNYLEAYILGG
jgi:signal-transduction protein with cAMP-binding, CBS, and nucleotidyltransferase domain